jgi:uncharacterized protein (DUF58 family)/TM2 domain-containing membrane protein YozV
MKRLRPTSDKTKGTLFVLWLVLGWSGAHRFYLGHGLLGALQLIVSLCTCFIGGIWGYVDGLALLFSRPKDAHGLPVTGFFAPRKIYADDVEHAARSVSDSLAHLMFHLGIMFLLPFVVGGAAGVLLETRQVRDTALFMMLLSAGILLPVLFVHVVGVLLKTREEARMLRAAGSYSTRTLLDAAARSAAILTPRGFIVLVTGLAFIVMALAYKWASLGVLAVLSLTAFYLMTGASALVSAFLVRRFGNDALARGGSLHRRYTPGVVRAGEPATETIDLARVPVPPGFFLLLEGELPARLDTRIRHVIPPRPRDERITLETPLKKTPRGFYDAPPLRVAFTDLLGFTKTSVASLATARLKVLPSLKPAEIVTPPPSDTEVPDILTRLHRFPTEDLFRFREYVAGDDTRRIHWKLSMKSGRLMVKKPESRESQSKRVLLALDTHVPESWLHHTVVLDDALDALTESWLSIAQKLLQDGQQVTLAVRARGDDGESRTEIIHCTRTNHGQLLDVGARVEWQGDAAIEAVLKDVGAFDSCVVVSMRLEAPPPIECAKETTWIYLHPHDALGPPPPSAEETWRNFDGEKRSGLRALARYVQLPYPAGSDDNALRTRIADYERKLEDRAHRVELRRLVERAGDQAITSLLHGDAAVYRVELLEGRVRLRGLKGPKKKTVEMRRIA